MIVFGIGRSVAVGTALAQVFVVKHANEVDTIKQSAGCKPSAGAYLHASLDGLKRGWRCAHPGAVLLADEMLNEVMHVALGLPFLPRLLLTGHGVKRSDNVLHNQTNVLHIKLRH